MVEARYHVNHWWENISMTATTKHIDPRFEPIVLPTFQMQMVRFWRHIHKARLETVTTVVTWSYMGTTRMVQDFETMTIVYTGMTR